MQTVAPHIQQVLSENFGLENLRPKQQEIIDCIMNGEHALALLPTGYGKSLCYQLPSQMLPGVTLVISPLISLMQDQVSGLERRGIKNAIFLNSSLSNQQISERLDGIRSGAYKLVYVAPERFDSPRFRELLATVQVSLLVIDEAHCISQWGHDFRPQYRNLSSHIPAFKGTTVLALTATATPAVQTDIVSALGLEKVRIVSGGFDRPNLRFEVKALANGFAKDSFIRSAILESPDPSIVYTSSKKEAERLAQFLNGAGVKAACYHAGMPGDRRQKTQQRFEKDEVQAIVGTVAFGMGIDKPNIRRVIHYNLPGSLEDYYQQAGRAGRDGQPATCTLLYQAKDIHIQKWLIGKNYPTFEQLDDLVKLLKRVSLRGISASEIINSIKIDDSALNSALDHMKALELVSFTDSGAYMLESDAAAKDMDFERLWHRRKRDEARLNSLVRYAEQSICRRAAILSYFGELRGGKCKGCDVCVPREDSFNRSGRGTAALTGKAGAKAGSLPNKITVKTVASAPKVSEVGQMQRSVLRLAQQVSGKVGRTSLAAILMGSRSKKILTAGFDQNPEYGTLRGYTEQRLLSCIDDLVSSGFLKVTSGLYPKVFVTALADQNPEAQLE